MVLAAELNEYSPSTPVKCTKKTLVEDKTGVLVQSYTNDRSGIFFRSLVIDYSYFTVNGFYKMGFVASSLLAPFKVDSPKFKKRYLVITWTDQLTELDSLYHALKGDFIVLETKRQALDQYERISKLLAWIKTEPGYLLKKATSKKMVPIFSEYVMNAGTPLSTLQSAFRDHVRK